MADMGRRIGRRIALLRHAAGMTQADLADRLGFTTYRYVSRIERGDTDLRATTLARIATVLGVEPYELLLFDASVPPAKRRGVANLLGGEEMDGRVRPLALDLMNAIVRWSRARRGRR